MHGIEPIVSIIVPVYNIEEFLSGCLNSLLCQTLSQIEILCVDDASEDHSVEVIQEFQSRDPRVQLLRQRHQGVSVARNLGIRHARGKYIAFIDGDDHADADMLRKMTAAAEETGCDMVICSAKVEFEAQNVKTIRQDRSIQSALTVTGGQWTADGTAEDIWHTVSRPGSWPFIWNKLIRTDLIREHGLSFSPELPLGEDGVFLQLLFQYVKHAVFLPDQFYHYRYRRKASATVKLSQNRQTRFPQHIAVVSELLRSFTERDLLEINRTHLLRWILRFLYFDFITLPPEGCTEASVRLTALFQQYNLLSKTEGLHHFEITRLKKLSSPAAPRTPAKRLLDIFLTKAQNRIMGFLYR